MTPSRELDARVAKVLFGLKRRLVSPALKPGEIRSRPGEINNFEDIYSEPDGEYSTSIEDAFLVVEKMRERRFPVWMRTEDKGWFVRIGLRQGVLSESLPRAICLAALGALEAEDAA